MTSERNKYNLKNIERELYNLECEKINTFIISSKDHSIFDTKILDINDISYSISLFGNKNSNEAIGVQIDKFKLDSLISTNRKYLLEFNSVIDFISSENKNIFKKLNRKNISNFPAILTN